MNRSYFSWGMVTASAFLAAPVLAQTAAGSDADSSGPMLQEIIITAQKRPERLQDVPAAASVLSSDALGNSNVSDVSDLNKLVPAININGSLNGRAPMGIRGISSNANEATVGLPSGVAIMIDGVPVPSDSFRGNTLEDLERVEILEGPQATLGGRTAAAGLINYVTHGPSDTFNGSFSATATTDSEYRLSGFVAGPISEKFEYSLSAFGNYVQFPEINLLNNDHTHKQTYGVRGKLLFKPTDGLDILLTADWQRQNSRGDNLIYSYTTPDARLLFGTNYPPPFILNTSMLTQAVLLPGVTPSFKNLAYTTIVPNAGQTIEDSDVSIVINKKIGDLTLTSTTAYQHETSLAVQDIFSNAIFWFNEFAAANGIPLPPYNNTNVLSQDVRQTSEELKLSSPTDVPLSYIVGFFFSDTKVGYFQTRDLATAEGTYYVEPITKTYDVYGRASWKFTSTSTITAGLRLNEDRLSYSQDQFLYQIDPSPAPPAGAHTSSGSDSSSAVVGDISFQQQLTPNVMAYATYARGYSPKVYNTALPLADDSTKAPISQEKINHFEIGTKGSYFNRRLTVDADVFDTIYNDYQIQSYAAVPGTLAPPLVLQSAGKAETRGVELNTAMAATNLLTLTLNLSYIDAKFKDYRGAPCWGGVGQETTAQGCNLDPATGQYVQDVSGKTMPNSPRFKGVLGVQQAIPLSADYSLNIGGTFSYRSANQFLPDQNPQAIQGSFGLLDMYLTFKAAPIKGSITAFANNLTNHHYAVDVEDFWTSPWGANTVIMQPARDSVRYFGLRYNMKF